MVSPSPKDGCPVLCWASGVPCSWVWTQVAEVLSEPLGAGHSSVSVRHPHRMWPCAALGLSVASVHVLRCRGQPVPAGQELV